MSATSPPPSPTKRNILRTLVTGVNPTDKATHDQRWHRSPEAPAPPMKDAGGPSSGGQGSGRVAGLVQGWEASLNSSSRPYSALSPAQPAPFRSSPGLPPSPALQPIPIAQPSQPSSPSSPSSPRGTSPTVPASFFQAKRNPPPAPNGAKFVPQPHPQAGKENQPRPQSSFYPGPRPASSLAASHGHVSAGSRSPTTSGSTSGRTDVSSATTALTNLTMATRSSDSTHASSLVTNSAENAYVGVAARVEAATPRKSPASQFVAGPSGAAGLRAPPQIVETAPTPQRRQQQQREMAPPSSSRPVSMPPVSYGVPAADSSSRHHEVQRPSAPTPGQRPQGPRPQTSFYEHLPPSRSPEPRPLPHAGAFPSPTLETSRYKPLPLDNTPYIRQGEPAPAAAPKTRGRPRASSLGAGLKTPYKDEEEKVETPEERNRRVEAEFEKLLDTMQLPDRTVRTKMLGLALPLKEEMLRSASTLPSTSSATLRPPSRPTHQRGRSLNLADSQSQSQSRPPPSTGVPVSKKEGGSGFKSTFLRKTKSGASLREKAAKDGSASLSVSTSGPGSSDRPRRPSSHSRTASATSILFRSFGKSSGSKAAAEASSAVSPTIGSAGAVDAEDATYWAVRLRSTKCAHLEVKELGRLRGRLRNEAPKWVDEFIKSGGYLGLLERLKELLEMEWREEQHDDQILYEVLRCFKALTMTACGKRALASHSPTPYLPLASLLFSEKRPGDLPCRQLLVELLHSIFEICPSSSDALPKSAWTDGAEISLDPAAPSSPNPAFGANGASGSGSGSGSGGARRYTRKIKSGEEDEDALLEREEVLTPERVQQAHRFVVSLMEGPPNEKEDAKVDFIRSTHRPRVYKTWVTEISDCVRDYFWIFCHANNLFWTLEQIDADAIEAPQVPSGMTGGVEFEAMAYCTAHFRLINAIARTCPTVEAAFAFHNQLFESGFERVLFTLRRASLVYYQSLHLEMSRYISLARSAHFNLGARILACLDRRFLSQQELMVLHQVEAQRKSFESRSGAPQLGAVF
ncbi:hypothetical protein JCM6882_007077 [Rhodosporidiobolus microsporus]